MAQVEGIQINILAKIDQLQKALDDAKKAIASVAQESEKQSERISNPLKGAADTIGAKYGWMAGEIATKLASLVNPATLAATAVTAIGAAIVAYANTSEESLKTIDQLFKEHEDTVKRVALVYPEITKGLDDVAREANNILQTRLRGDIVNLQAELKSASEDFINSIAQTTPTATSAIELILQKFGAMRNTVLILSKDFEPFRGAIVDFQNSVRSGAPDIESFKQTIAELAIQFQDNESIQKFAREILRLAENVDKANLKLQNTQTLLSGTQNEASGAAEALRTYNDAIKTLEGISPKKIDDLTKARNAANEALKNENLTTQQAAEIKAKLAETEKRIAEDAASRMPSGKDNSAERLAREQEMITKRLEMLTVGWGTEEEKLAAHLVRNQDLINQAREKEAIDDETHKILMLGAEEEYQKRIQKVREKTNLMALSSTANMFGSLMRLTETFGKKGTGLAKAFGIAQALINTYVGVTKALSTLPPPASYAAAAATLAQGMAQVASIRSVSDTGKGGGGAVSSSGSGAAATAASGAGGGGQPGGNSVYINLQGQSFGRDQVRDLVKQIADFQKDGGQVVFA